MQVKVRPNENGNIVLLLMEGQVNSEHAVKLCKKLGYNVLTEAYKLGVMSFSSVMIPWQEFKSNFCEIEEGSQEYISDLLRTPERRYYICQINNGRSRGTLITW